MRKHLREAICLGMAVGLLIITPVVAAETSTSGTDRSSETADSSSSSEDSVSRTARLEKLKSDLKIKIEDKEALNLKTRCKSAQTKVGSVREKVASKVPGRTKAYGELTDRLSGLVVKLKAKGVDTTVFEQEIDVLKAKISTFNTDLASYKQMLADLKGNDCVTDPAAFKAALQASRTDRDKIIKDAADIKAYIKDTVKPTLQQIRTTLEANEKTSGEDH